MIAYKYIDTKGATIAALRDYKNMRAIIDNTPEKVKETYTNIININAIKINDVPQQSYVHYQEDKIIKSLDKIDLLEERYKIALEYMKWFTPAWNSLKKDEKVILEKFYMAGNLKSGATKQLCEDLYSSSSTIDRIRRKSLEKLSLVLYGK